MHAGGPVPGQELVELIHSREGKGTGPDKEGAGPFDNENSS